ncbi:MAG: hypothetical protein WCS86_01565 [Candidatus Paceibacterota bacterium]
MIKQFKSTDKILVLDFDHNCYDTDAFLLFEIRNPMINNWNIPVVAWQEAYEKAAKVGYTLEVHREELIKILNYEPFTLEDIRNFEKGMDFSKYLYFDVLPFLTAAKEKGYRTMLLSFGDPGWQDKKVKGVKLDKVMDVIKFTKEEGNKAETLIKYVKDCEKIIFVENNGLDLDAVHKILPRVDIYFMNRVPTEAMNPRENEFIKMRYDEARKIALRQVVFKHKKVSSFNEITL